MLVGSFDVGTTNLAFCIIDGKMITHWEVIDIAYKTNDQLCVKVVEALDSHPELLQVDHIVIEKQPSKNNKMRIVEALLNAYFVINGTTKSLSRVSKVCVYSSKHKLGASTIKGKTNYRERKKLAITRCSQYLTETSEIQNENFVNLFVASKKKDDLADCLLQGLSYIQDDTFASIQNKNLDTACKICCRKPNKRQEAKMYSKSNLKFFFSKYNTYDDLCSFIQSSLKIQKAMLHWYKDDVKKALREFNMELN